MQPEWFPIIDTALKIGLGALISGLFTLLALKHKSSSEVSNMRRENQTKLLEEAAAELQVFIAALHSFTSLVGGIAKQNDIDKKDSLEFSSISKSELLEEDERLTNSWAEKQNVNTKLNLLKADDALQKFKEVSLLESELRNRVHFKHECPSLKEQTDFVARLRIAIRELNVELGNVYSKIWR